MGTIADAAMLGPALSPVPPDADNADAVGDEAMQTLSDNAVQQKQAEVQQAPFQKITHKFNPKTGKYDVSADISADTFDYLQNLIQTGKAAQDSFAQARMQLAQKRIFQEQHPFVSAIGKVASTAAAQYGSGYGPPRGRDISPIIRAAGAYGLEQFGQTNADLAQQEAGLQAQEFGVANTLYNQKQQQDVIDQTQARENRREKSDQTRFELSYMGQLNQQARDEAYSQADLPGLTDQIYKSGLASSPEAAQSFARGLIATSEARQRVRQAEAKAKLDSEERRSLESDKRFMQIHGRLLEQAQAARGDKQQKLAEEDADNLLIAQGIVKGDPTSLNVYGTRTGGRAKLLATVKKLDPNGDWSETKINTRAKAWTDLADQQKTGALGTQLAVYDTFIQHTEELDNLTSQLGGTDSPLLNKPLNKLRKGALGNPILYRWLVVSSAVGKEYEGVLLRGRALYKDDREEVDRMLNLNVPGKVLLQTTNQQRQITADRVRSSANSFQRTTGRELPNNSISEESKAILEKNGIRVPIEGTPGSKAANSNDNAARAATGNPVARAPQGTPDGPIQYKGKPAVVRDGVIYAQ